MIKACIFDMDGVLTDSETLLAEAACNIFKEQYGFTVTRKDFEPFIGAGEERYLMGVAEKVGASMTMPEGKKQLYDAYLDMIPGRLQPVEGVVEFVHRLRERGIQTAVATSADERKMTANLREIGLPAEGFAAVIKREDVKNAKPAPDLFLHAAETMKIDPVECVVFEDAINGIQAALSAGSKAIGVTGSFTAEVLLEAGADGVLDHFHQAETVLTDAGLLFASKA